MPTDISQSRNSRSDGRFWVLYAFFVGALSSFTVPVVGTLPVGEPLLLLPCVVFLLRTLNFRRPLSGPFRLRLFWIFAASLLVVLCAYIITDQIRESSFNDCLRGWARVAFLLVDVVGMTFLLAENKNSLGGFAFGTAVGESLFACLLKPLFGDYWKFGFGRPLTYLLSSFYPGRHFIAPFAILLAFSGIHFMLGFRSFSMICLASAALLSLQFFARDSRRSVLVALTLFGLAARYLITQSGQDARSQRSDIEREAMLRAATEAFWQSPLIGHGSWFHKSRVIDEFEIIRWQIAKERGGVGGFSETGTKELVIHSQMLAALAEAGVCGGTFFLAYGFGLLWAIFYTAVDRPFDRLSALILVILTEALFALLLSPFSGVARVFIATASAIILLLRHQFLLGRTNRFLHQQIPQIHERLAYYQATGKSASS